MQSFFEENLAACFLLERKVYYFFSEKELVDPVCWTCSFNTLLI